MISEAYVREILAERDELAEKLRQLKDAMRPKGYVFPREWRLSPKEDRVLSLLAKRGSCSLETFMASVYSDALGDMPNPEVLRVYVFKLRHKLKSIPIIIEVDWGRGYSVPQPSLEKLNKYRACDNAQVPE